MAARYLANYGIDLNAIITKVQQGGDAMQSGLQSATSSLSPQPITRIIRARLPQRPPISLWDVSISEGRIAAIEAHDPTLPSIRHLPGVKDAMGRLLAPSLCHSHIHLDKCFLLQDPKYSDFGIVEGDFNEAMELTGKAKSLFESDDLLRRGTRLIEESLECGVTAMRAFVEIDEVVGLKCLEAGLKLRADFEAWCDIQICAFAQLALFSGEDAEKRRSLMEEAISRQRVDVIGSTPYVEDDQIKTKENITWVIEKAIASGKALDFHLDYHLQAETQPLIWFVISELKRLKWPTKSSKGKTVCLGHCTRLTFFTPDDWQRLHHEIGDLAVSFIGLPTSDLFMMGRTDIKTSQDSQRPRGTLQIPEIIKKYSLSCALAINNVGNAFTPYGNCDPLNLASLGVGMYHAGTSKDTEVLYECVSSRSKEAIGLAAASLELKEGEPADIILYGSKEYHWRRRKTIADLVYDPSLARVTFLRGKQLRYP